MQVKAWYEKEWMETSKSSIYPTSSEHLVPLASQNWSCLGPDSSLTFSPSSILNFVIISILMSAFLTDFYYCQHYNHQLSFTYSWLSPSSAPPLRSSTQLLTSSWRDTVSVGQRRPATLIVFIVNCFIFTIIVHILITNVSYLHLDEGETWVLGGVVDHPLSSVWCFSSSSQPR